MRPGTEAVPNIAAFAKACEIRMAHFDEDYAHVQELADYLCVDRSAMTVALMALKREGLVELDGRTARLLAKNSERRDLHGI